MNPQRPPRSPTPLRLHAGLLAIALGSLLGLAACGFHMVGEAPLPDELKTVYLDAADPFRVTEPPVEVALQKRIERRGGAIKSKIEQATSVLRISNLTERQDVLSIGPDGKAIEYRLVTKLRYELDRDGKALIEPGDLTVTRDYSFNAQQILAKEVEQARLRDYLQDEMADLLLLRLETGLRKQAKAGG